MTIRQPCAVRNKACNSWAGLSTVCEQTRLPPVPLLRNCPTDFDQQAGFPTPPWPCQEPQFDRLIFREHPIQMPLQEPITMPMKRHNPAGWQQQEAVWHILLEHIRPFEVWDLYEGGCRAAWNSGLRLDRYYLRTMSVCRGRLREPLCTSCWRCIGVNAERFTKLSGSMLPRAHQLCLPRSL